MPIDLATLTVHGVQSAFAEGAITAETLVQLCLDRVATWNPHYNAIVILNPGALEDARASDRRRAEGDALGPLDGLPIVIKDTMDMAGLPTTGGWRLLHADTGGVALVPATDSPVVARMRDAGCVILGKTNVPVLSHSGSHADDSWAGPTFNAASRDLLPGGSSTGTATAVAAGLAVLGLGEETGGSIQNPASAQALVGVRPTFALVPNTGVMPLSSGRDVVGPIARCVRDAALCLDVLAGDTAEDPKTAAGVGHRPAGGYASTLDVGALNGKRLGLYGPGWRDQPLCPETARLYGRAVGEIEALGAVPVKDPFAGSGFAALRRPTPPLGQFDARGMESLPHDLQRYFERLGPEAALTSFADFVRATVSEDAFAPSGVLGYMAHFPAFGASVRDPGAPPDLSEFVAARDSYRRIVAEVFARERLDGLVFPQMSGVVPPLRGTEPIRGTTTGEINIAGLPGVTVPAGYHASGAPFGLIFVGPMWSEADLLGFAFAYEAATRHRRVPVLAPSRRPRSL